MIKTTKNPFDKNALYIQVLYHEFFYGPFFSIKEIAKAINNLNKIKPYWDYDCYGIFHGSKEGRGKSISKRTRIIIDSLIDLSQKEKYENK